MSKQVTNTIAVLAFFDQEKAPLPAIRITEQPMLLTKSKIKRGIFAKIGQKGNELYLSV